MRAAALVVLACASVRAQPASLEGIAVNAVTGEPLGGVHVRLYAGSFDGAGIAYGTLSGAGGRFSISSIEPGSYLLQPERRGFVYLGKAGAGMPGITLKSGRPLAGFRLEMTPEAVIAGRVVDEYGDPVQYVNVQAEPVTKVVARPAVFRQDRVTTDDRGMFRLSGAPGKYRLRAMPMRMGGMEAEIRTDGTRAVLYGPTYYPGVAGADRAGIVEAAAGGETSGIEIRLLASQPGGSVSGIVSGIPEGASATVVLLAGENANQVRFSQGRGAGPDGRFSFRHLDAGVYRLYAHSTGGKAQLQSQGIEVRLDGSDAPDVNLALEPGGDLTGTLEVPPAPAGKRTVRLEPLPEFAMFGEGGSHAADVDKDGSFRISDIPPARYRLHVEPLGVNGYVKELSVDGKTAEAGILDFSRGVHGARVKIAASPNGGQLEGRVLDPDGTPLLRIMGSVWLMRDPEEAALPEHITTITPEGRYAFHAVRPGKYRLVALDMFHSGTDARETRKEAFAAAAEIEIQEGDRITKDVKVASDNAK